MAKARYRITRLVLTPNSPTTNIRFDVTYQKDGQPKTLTLILHDPAAQKKHGLLGETVDDEGNPVPKKWTLRKIDQAAPGGLVRIYRTSQPGQPASFEL